MIVHLSVNCSSGRQWAAKAQGLTGWNLDDRCKITSGWTWVKSHWPKTSSYMSKLSKTPIIVVVSWQVLLYLERICWDSLMIIRTYSHIKQTVFTVSSLFFFSLFVALCSVLWHSLQVSHCLVFCACISVYLSCICSSASPQSGSCLFLNAAGLHSWQSNTFRVQWFLSAYGMLNALPTWYTLVHNKLIQTN